jgi:hypothetical protein
LGQQVFSQQGAASQLDSQAEQLAAAGTAGATVADSAAGGASGTGFFSSTIGFFTMSEGDWDSSALGATTDFLGASTAGAASFLAAGAASCPMATELNPIPKHIMAKMFNRYDFIVSTPQIRKDGENALEPSFSCPQPLQAKEPFLHNSCTDWHLQ